MKISLKWLNQYVDVVDYFSQPGQLATILTDGGLEVEEVEDRAKDFEHVVIGQILEKNPHPDADKLTVCQVTTGDGRCHTIVCGAKNHNVNDVVVVALPGAILPGDFKIKQSKIRGVESSGMLCSATELGMDDDGSRGILILPQEAKVGISAAKYFGFDDVVFELKVTPNRADCLSHYGLAREVSCLLGSSYQLTGEAFSKTSEVSTCESINLEVKNSDLCPRYTGRCITGVKISDSPSWLKQRLQSVGINSINNVVDITNYVMLELGQPLHAFDKRFLDGQTVIVDSSTLGEKFVTLDGTEIELTGEELVIRDSVKPIALAGVVGGLNSGVKEDTCDLFIESAYFLPSTVRKTSKRFGIETDSAYRFSRGVNPDAVLLALDRACELILGLAGGRASEDYYDHYPQPLQRESIDLNIDYVNERLGFMVSQKNIENCLQRVGCEILESQEGRVKVQPPIYRWDISMNMDLIEEVARLQGYDQIPETLPVMEISPKKHHGSFVFHNRVADLLAALGYRQAVNYAFISSDFQDKVLGDKSTLCHTGLETSEKAVSIRNPLTEELNVMRLSLIPGLLKNLSFNNNYGNSYGRLFETGFSFSKLEEGYKEYARLAFTIWGSRGSVWQEPSDFPIVFELKASIEKLLLELGISSWSWLQDDKGPDFLHSGQRTILKCEGKKIGYIGTLHPKWKTEWKLREDVAVAELDLDLLGIRQPRVSKVKGVSKFPSVKRDLSLVMSRDLPVMDVVQVIRKACGAILKDVEIFDLYEDSQMEAGQRSVGFRMEYQDEAGTLDDKRLLELQNGVLEAVENKFSIGIR